jgi:tripartite-type tricarboxylate transporter receptor subunit TctC
VVANWYGLAAPKGTPRDVTDKVYAQVQKALADPSVKERLAQQGAEPLDMNGDAFAAS